MKILIDIGHPAHVHHFKYVIKELETKGHEILVTTVDKEITLQLLSNQNFKYKVIGKNRTGYFFKMFEYIKSVFKALKIIKKYSPDISVGRASPVLAISSFILKVPYISFSDTEDAKLIRKFSHPFAKAIITPKSYFLDLGKKHIKYSGNHELAYLHPIRFKADTFYLEKFNLDPNKKLVFVRFVSWNATHDAGHKGIDDDFKIKLVKELSKHADVIVNSENNKVPDKIKQYQLKFPPQDVHHIFGHLSLFVGESTTMASECAVLGVPSIYINPRKNGYINDEQKAGLLYQFENPVGVIDKAKNILTDEDKQKVHEINRKKFLGEKIDVTSFMVWFIENYPQSIRILESNPNFYNFI